MGSADISAEELLARCEEIGLEMKILAGRR